MGVASVIHDQIQHDADASLPGLMQHRRKVAETAQPWVHAIVVTDVVAAVPLRGRVDGVEPDQGNAQAGQVVQPGDQPLEVTYPITVGVLEQADVKRIEDTGPVPAGKHARPLPAEPSFPPAWRLRHAAHHTVR
jgi:hypothetical protein